jgi:hypothetical protein
MRRLLMILALLAAASVALAGNAAGATASVNLRETGVELGGGTTALVFVEVRCTTEPGEQLLEGAVTVSQDAAFGMAGLNPVCNGKRRIYPIRVNTFDGAFESGEAFVSAFLIFIDSETQDTTSFGDFTVITLR